MRPFPFVLALAALSAAFAVDTRFWTFAAKEDHDKATLKRLSLRSDGRITLAPATRELQDAGVSYLWAVARGADGTLYTGGGNPGATAAKLFAVKAGQSRVLAELPGLQIQSIALDGGGRIYAATAPDGKVYRVNADGKSEVFYDPKAKYIWTIAFDKAGNLYVATGDHGEIHKVTPSGQGNVFFKTEEEHARAMAVDAAGNLIIGTEPSGLVMRVSPTGEGFVLHQAGRREVTAIAISPDGSIYAAAVGAKPASATPALPPAPAAAPITTTSITVTASGGGSGPVTAPRPAPPTLTPSSVSGGSELIRISADGFPTRVWFDGAEIIYAITFDKAGLPVIGTGNKGGIYRIDSDLRHTRLLTLAPTQVTGLTNDTGGAIYAVTGNIGKLFQVGPGSEKDGVIESEVLDASWFAEWGRLAPKTSGNVTFETRSGNLDRPQKNWSAWTPVQDRIASPGARFLQYRATLSGDGAELTGTDIAYQPRNVAPKIEQIEITAPNYRMPNQTISMTPSTTLTLGPMSSRVPHTPAGSSTDPGAVTMNWAKGTQGARWKAGDANGDAVQYTVEIRGERETVWKLLKKELSQRQYSFDASAFPDGLHRLRITASDAEANPPGKGLTGTLESEPFLIDNTPPVIRGLTAAANGNKLTITFSAADALTILTKAEYSINATEWTFFEPSTRLSDSREHSYSITVDRPAGELTIAVRVSDEHENHAVEKTTVK